MHNEQQKSHQPPLRLGLTAVALVTGACAMIHGADQIAINTLTRMQCGRAKSGRAHVSSPDQDGIIPLATSDQTTQQRDWKETVRICKLRRPYRELCKPVRIGQQNDVV